MSRSASSHARSRIREIAGSKWGMAAADIGSRVTSKMRDAVQGRVLQHGLRARAAHGRPGEPQPAVLPDAGGRCRVA